MVSVKIEGEEPMLLRKILESKGIAIARRYEQPDYFLYIKYGTATSVRSEEKSLKIIMNSGNEILAAGLALEAIITGSGIDFQHIPEKKTEKKILVVGAGGVGSNCCLALYNLGTAFTVMDFDTIEEHNAQSQFLFKEHQGRKKVEVIAGYTNCRFIDGKIEDHPEVFQSHDLILSCVDNWEARISIGKAARRLGKELLNISVSAMHASIDYIRGCLQCFYKPETGKKSCHETQNLFAMNYIAGALAAEIANSSPKSISVVNTGRKIVNYSKEKEVYCAC